MPQGDPLNTLTGATQETPSFPGHTGCTEFTIQEDDVQQLEETGSEGRARSWTRGRGRLVLAGAVLALVLAVGGPFAYINFVQEDAPERLGVATATTGGDTAAATGASLDGTWTVAGGSQAGYRVEEVLLGQNVEAVGRTSAVTGELTVAGTRSPAAPSPST